MSKPLSWVAAHFPWWGKIATKVILTRLPLDYKVFKRFGLIQHGAMEEPSYAHGVFRKHFDAARSQTALNGFVGLELGPGDSLLSALVGRAYGASTYYLIDAGPFAQTSIQGYCEMSEFLAKEGLPHLRVTKEMSGESVLAACHATYGTCGLESLRAIPDKSVNFIWSHTVLQHIRRMEFLETMRQLRRQLRDDGICSHWVDLQDCLGGALNNLRFSDATWESSFMASSGFYTNRLRYSEMLAIFKEVGFHADVIAIKRWDSLPTERSKMFRRFGEFSDDDLRVRVFHVLLRPV